jgi:hypothetical protein
VKKKRCSCLAIICCAVPIAIVNCAVPITTEKKRYSRMSVVTPFQLQPKKKRYSCLAIIRCAVTIAIVAPFQLRPEKKRYSCLSVVTPFQIRPEKKTKIWQVRDHYYDRKKKILVVCLAGA